MILAGIVFSRVGSRGHPHLFDVLTPEKFPPFGLEVVAVCVVAGIAWAFIDAWTHPSPEVRKARKGGGVMGYALFRLVSGFFAAALFATYFIARGSAAPGHAREAMATALTPEGFAPIAIPVISIGVIAALIWAVAGILRFNSGEPGAE